MELSSLSRALVNFNEKELLSIIGRELNSNRDPLSIAEELRVGIQEVGDRFGKGEFFLAELVAAAKFFENGMRLVEPRLTKSADEKTLGKVLIGTVAGDVHDLGKNIVCIVLKMNGFEVHDIGVNVPVQTFVDKANELNPDIIGISCLLTTSVDPMKTTIQELKKAERKRHCKILIGGGIINEKVREYVGADYFGANAMEAVQILKEIVGGFGEARHGQL